MAASRIDVSSAIRTGGYRAVKDVRGNLESGKYLQFSVERLELLSLAFVAVSGEIQECGLLWRTVITVSTQWRSGNEFVVAPVNLSPRTPATTFAESNSSRSTATLLTSSASKGACANG